VNYWLAIVAGFVGGFIGTMIAYTRGFSAGVESERKRWTSFLFGKQAPVLPNKET